MANADVRRDVMKVDAIVQQLPGFRETFPLRDFFRDNMHLIERYENGGAVPKAVPPQSEMLVSTADIETATNAARR